MRILVVFCLLLAALSACCHGHGQDEAVEVVVTPRGEIQRNDAVRPVPVHEELQSPQDPQLTKSPIPHASMEPTVAKISTQKQSADQQSTRARLSVALLQKELQTVETMIALQSAKIQTLEKLRASLVHDATNTGDATAAGLQSLGLNRRQRGQYVAKSELEDAIDRKLDALTAQVLDTASSMEFDSYFVERTLLDLQLPQDAAVAIQIDKIKSRPTQELVAIGLQSGQVRLTLASGKELLRIDTKIQGLAGIQLDLVSEPPLLVVFSRGQASRVIAYALSLEHTAKTGEIVATATQLMALSPTRSSLPSSPASGSATAVAIARSPRRSVVSVAHGGGAMAFYALNGSVLHGFATEASHEISVMATHQHLVAFANGSAVVVVPMSRHATPEFQLCAGSLAAVTSIAFDPVFHDVLYAGTADGDVLTFLFTMAASPVESENIQAALTCRLVQRSVLQRAQPVALSAFKGHLLAASPTRLTLFTVTRSSSSGSHEIVLRRMCSKIIDTAVAEDRGVYLPRMAVAENGHSTLVALITDTRTGTGAGVGSNTPSLLVMQSLLPSEPGVSSGMGDTSGLWRGATTIGMVAVALLTAQYFLRGQQTPLDGASLPDSEQWRELLDKHRRDAAPAATPGSRGRAFPRGSRAAGFPSERRPPTSAASASAQAQYMGDAAMFGATVEAFAKARGHKMRGGVASNTVEATDPELRRRIQDARRETLECTFDDEDEYEEEY